MAEEKMDWLEDLNELNKELEERILEANEDKTLIKWSKLLPDLMTSEILMVGQFTGVKNANGEDALGILMLQKDGKAIVPFFTNPSRVGVLANPQNNQFDIMKVNVVRFFQSIAGKPCVMNPMSEYAKVFTPFEMKVLAAENEDKVPPLPNTESKGEN